MFGFFVQVFYVGFITLLLVGCTRVVFCVADLYVFGCLQILVFAFRGWINEEDVYYL